MSRVLPAAVATLALTFAAPAAKAQVSPHAEWDGLPQAAEWTGATLAAVAGFETLNPADISDFCPGYGALGADDRKAVWVELVSAVAKAESGLKPETSHWSAFDPDAGRPTFRRGLLQISIESAKQPVYGCAVASPEELAGPAANLTCGATILNKLVSQDGVVAGPGGDKPRGAARYWPSLARPTTRAVIAASVKALPVCAVAP